MTKARPWSSRPTSRGIVRRIVMPAMIAIVLGALGGAVAYNALVVGPEHPKETSAPIRLTMPRLVGRDDQGRAFVITAQAATRDPRDYQRVFLDEPALIMDAEGPDPVRIVARHGVYHEASFKLDLHGGVKLESSRAVFDTIASIFDAKTGDLVGSGPIQGSGSLGEIAAKSYGVYGKGDRMIFKGGVHTRLDKK
jgi:lipopolysaccharide export system protein LptC